MIDPDKGTVIGAVSEGKGYLLLTAVKGIRSKQGGSDNKLKAISHARLCNSG